MGRIDNLLNEVTTDQTGSAFKRVGNVWTYQASIAGTGAVSATVTIQVSNDGTNWEDFGSLSLSGTTTASDSVSGDAPWAAHRAVCASISGTGAKVTAAAYGG
jgi:hypothetical protein